MTMTEIKHEIDANFTGRLNIPLRVLCSRSQWWNYFHCWVVIGVASDEQYLDYLFIRIGRYPCWCFSMAGMNMSLYPQKDMEEAAVAREQLLLDKESNLQTIPHAAYLQNGECETSAQLWPTRPFKNPLKALVEKNTVSSTKSLPTLGICCYL